MMKIISSQRYLDFSIVDEKVEELKDEECVTLPIIDAGMRDMDGNDLYILIDGHHRKEAAEELGLEVKYEEVENEHNMTGDDLLVACYLDSDWYYIDNGYTVF